ncbi:hypothetical protein [Acidithiobacillus sp. AMEEHan]|uniref:hypothetical protein n=1 Tax=Acidithiobacillus sp. AMEEHan TaxID=2994951 RepID=UPI0027E52F62|nr:hypothetical protein [Acidithiobacillus sp. AMEEHan]
MPEALFSAARLGVGQVFSGAGKILRSHFWGLSLNLLLLGLAALFGFALLGLAAQQASALRLLWTMLESLWTNVLLIGFFRAIALASAGRPYEALAPFWSLRERDAWLLALPPAIINVLLLQSSGYLALQGHSDPAMALAILQRPVFWFTLFASYLVGTFFQYIYALYAAYGLGTRIALSSATRLLGDRLGWLFFPLLVGLVLAGAALLLAMIFSAIAGLLIGTSILHNPGFAGVFTLIFLLFLFPAFIWASSCTLLAAANLIRNSSDTRFVP